MGNNNNNNNNNNTNITASKSSGKEVDPIKGRFLNTGKVLGVGAFKTVYLGFDRTKGFEVAWNEIRLNQSGDIDWEKLWSEVRLLKSLNHANIIECIGGWVDKVNKKVKKRKYSRRAKRGDE